jgi:hypothetical protein
VTPGTPGASNGFALTNLKPATAYVVGIRALGACGEASAIAVLEFETAVMKFTQLSGCFVATAAWGGGLGREVGAMRRARDALRDGSRLFAAAADLYAREGPAAADLVRRADVVRALVRGLLRPVGALAEAAGPMSP